MTRIEGQVADQEELAKQVLSWITCAKRPLTLSELQCALAVEEGEFELDEDNLPQIEDLITVCAGLVTVDKESGIIRLVHYTAQEYFERTQIQWFPDAETNITTICVTYLLFDVFKTGFCQGDEFIDRLESNQFFAYASKNWGHHARAASTLGQPLGLAVLDFLQSESKVDASSQGLFAIKRYYSCNSYSIRQVPRMRITGVHLAAYFGVKTAVNLLLEKGAELEVKDERNRTPLWYAARNGHKTVVQQLLEKGAELEAKDERNRTPLWYAVRSGHEAVVQLLLEKGAKLEANDKRNRTPLCYAAERGHEAVVRVLLDTGQVKADSKDAECGRTPLSWAAGNGHEAVVRLLLDTGQVKADSKDTEYGRTPLSYAAEGGHEAVVRLLLDTGQVEADSKDTEYGRTPLSYANWNGYEAVVQLLLDNGADVGVENRYGWTALKIAALNR